MVSSFLLSLLFMWPWVTDGEMGQRNGKWRRVGGGKCLFGGRKEIESRGSPQNDICRDGYTHNTFVEDVFEMALRECASKEEWCQKIVKEHGRPSRPVAVVPSPSTQKCPMRWILVRPPSSLGRLEIRPGRRHRLLSILPFVAPFSLATSGLFAALKSAA